MRFQFSAGGIVFRQAQDFGSKPQFSKNNIEILVCQHSQHHGWVFPKGLIGDHPSAGSGQAKKETKEQAALREVEEETGVLAKIVDEFEPVTYWFVFSSKGGSASGGKGEKIKKTVYYFLMEYVKGNISKHDFEMENVEWIPKNEVLERLSYPSDKKVWQVALRVINRRLKAN